MQLLTDEENADYDILLWDEESGFSYVDTYTGQSVSTAISKSQKQNFTWVRHYHVLCINNPVNSEAIPRQYMSSVDYRARYSIFCEQICNAAASANQAALVVHLNKLIDEELVAHAFEQVGA